MTALEIFVFSFMVVMVVAVPQGRQGGPGQRQGGPGGQGSFPSQAQLAQILRGSGGGGGRGTGSSGSSSGEGSSKGQLILVAFA